MKKLVLVEKNHLIRLGLHKLFSGLSNEWEVVSLDIADILELSDAAQTADLVVLGLPADATEDHCKLVTRIEHVLNPTNMLLLSEHCSPWSPTEYGAQSVYACISKKAAPATLVAAVRLGMSYERFLSGRADSAPTHKPLPALAPKTVSELGCGAGHDDRTVRQDKQRPDAMSRALGSEANSGLSDPISTPSLGKHSEAGRSGAELLNITPRQFEVLELLARGYPIKMVARMMDIATATAKAHTASLYRQLNVNSRGEAVYAARQKGALLN